MFFELDFSHEYKSNTVRLVYLSKKSYLLYENLHNKLKFMQEMGFPSIGNPVLKLENQVLTLVYMVMQHEINCGLYNDLVSENIIDEDLQAQLEGLYEMTNMLAIQYHTYLDQWKILKEQGEKQIIEINQLPISA